MSFILDALKKSETERQQQSSAEFSSVPTSSGNPNPARWLWLLGILLLVNFAVLIGILFKPTATEDAVSIGSTSSRPAATASDFEDQVAVAIENRPPQSAAPAPQTAGQQTVSPPNPAPRQTAGSSRVSVAEIPTIDELLMEGTLQIAQLHLDIHVYSEAPAERFVFINMTKHREGSQTPEGPVVREIRKDGVVLDYQGRVFLLPRE